MKRIAAAFIATICVTGLFAQDGIIKDEHILKAKQTVSKMTIDEKLSYVSGWPEFYLRPLDRFGIPALKTTDGPQGVRDGSKSTLYPSGICLAATWNRDLLYRVGVQLGQDTKAHDAQFLLGPGVNIARSPLCGRNFEYFGEDPYLASETAVQYIRGVQSEGVSAVVKHYALNNSEYDRNNMGSDADERTMFEIYFQTFMKAVKKADVGAVMTSYNPINGVHASENWWTNVEVLRNRWGFRGIVMSDWGSTYSAYAPVNGGLDLEMGVTEMLDPAILKKAIENGVIEESKIDLMCQHILQTVYAFGLDKPVADKPERDNPASRAVALDAAREGIVLLKNERNLLPLKGKVLLLGPSAHNVPRGGGSGYVDPYHECSVADGMKEIFGKKMIALSDNDWRKDITAEIGPWKAEYFPNIDYAGAPALVREDPAIDFFWDGGAPEGMPEDNFSVKWTTVFTPSEDMSVLFSISGDDGYGISVDGKEVISDWTRHSITVREAMVDLKAGRPYRFDVGYYEAAGSAEVHLKVFKTDAVKLRKKLSAADAVVLCIGFDADTEREGADRSFELPQTNRLAMDMAFRFSKNVVAVVNAGAGVEMESWIDKAAAVLMAWYPGQEGGKAVAEILAGKVNPSGKLPVTFDRRWEDNPCYDTYNTDYRSTYWKREKNVPRIQYSEGVFMGYRGYDKAGKEPLFPFGYGLSYTSFSYSDLEVKPVEKGYEVSFTLRNTGKKAGAEVAQVYVGDLQASVPRPLKELKGYEKVYLKKGESKRVNILLEEDAFSLFDTSIADFRVEPGQFEISVGGSSGNLPLKTLIDIK